MGNTNPYYGNKVIYKNNNKKYSISSKMIKNICYKINTTVRNIKKNKLRKSYRKLTGTRIISYENKCK